MCCISQEEALLSAFAPRLLHLEHVKLSAQRSRWPICPALTVLFSHAPLYLSPPCYYIFPLAHSDFLYDECPHLTHFQFLPIIYSVFGQSCASHSVFELLSSKLQRDFLSYLSAVYPCSMWFQQKLNIVPLMTGVFNEGLLYIHRKEVVAWFLPPTWRNESIRGTEHYDLFAWKKLINKIFNNSLNHYTYRLTAGDKSGTMK